MDGLIPSLLFTVSMMYSLVLNNVMETPGVLQLPRYSNARSVLLRVIQELLRNQKTLTMAMALERIKAFYVPSETIGFLVLAFSYLVYDVRRSFQAGYVAF